MKGDHKANYEKAKKEIRRLEKENEGLRQQLAQQATEVQIMGKASMEIRGEDTQQLADYKETNTNLLKFVEKVAKSKSKFGKDARKVLGYDS